MIMSVSDIIIGRFLEDVDKNNMMPWQRPYERYNSFNYFTMAQYRGINRLLLPFGEYITKRQITNYNIKNGFITVKNGKCVDIKPEAYRMQKGIKWYPVVYYNTNTKPSNREEVISKFPDIDKNLLNKKDVVIGVHERWVYFIKNGKYIKSLNFLKYYSVADRKYFRNSKGECLPSRLETGEVEIIKQEPMNVINNYVKRSGVRLITNYTDVPNYTPSSDTVYLNPYIKNEDRWFSTAFHELGHSTGSANRLNREGVIGSRSSKDVCASEECIAEICACLCCAETGIYDFKTSGTNAYNNNIAYVQAWKERIKDWGSSFIYIVSQADKAFNYICEGIDDSMPEDIGEDSMPEGIGEV